MLQVFAVQNFRGFKDRIELNLSNPSRYDFNEFAIENGTIKNGIVFGPNGSGKTNLGLAIFDLVNHLTQKMKIEDYYKNFVYAGNTQKPVVFEYKFKFGDKIVHYKYKKDETGRLLEETMYINDKLYLELNKTTANCVEFDIAEHIKNDFLSSDNSVSLTSYLWSNYPLKENHILITFKKFIDSMLWYKCLDERKFIGLESHATNIEEFIIKNNLVQDFEEFLKVVSDQKFDLVSGNFRNQTSIQPLLLCKFGQKDNLSLIPFYQIASTGTQALELLYYWIQKASQASFVFIDEFDAFYHFHISFEVCKRLFGLKNCQVFLSSHNTYLITNELLRPDCYFILASNKIKSLPNCTDKELRFAHNLEKLYRGGAFKV